MQACLFRWDNVQNIKNNDLSGLNPPVGAFFVTRLSIDIPDLRIYRLNQILGLRKNGDLHA